MNLEYPTTQQIPLRGRIERFGSVAALVLEFAQSGAIGILKIGRLELHVCQQHITHAVHEGLDNQEATLAILQLERGNYAFFAQDPLRTVQFDASLWALRAMQQLDESRQHKPQTSLVVLPSLKAALELIGGLNGLKHWTAEFQKQKGLLLERRHLRVLAKGVTLDEFRSLLTAFQNGSSA
jgi:hypothetical protein